MIHLRIVSPASDTEGALGVLEASRSVCNIVTLPGAARRPQGDVLLADVAREDASVVVAELRALGLHHSGSIALEAIDSSISDAHREAERVAAGAESDAVVWEEVEERTSETAELSASFLLFMVLASLIAAVGIFLNTPILIVGAMVVGPEFGPIAGVCVAIVQRRRPLALRSAQALGAGFPIAIAASFLASVVFRATGLTPDTFTDADHELARLIANPDFFAGFVAFCAGAAGMVSLTTAKSGALIGVLISVTTIPAAANIGIALAYGDGESFRGSLGQLAINLVMILVAGTMTLGIQRLLYARRRNAVRAGPGPRAGAPRAP